MTVTEAARLLRARSISATELLQATLDRLDATEPVLHAYAHVARAAALTAARQADRELAGRRSRGPLHGIPIAVKDVFVTRDAPTSAGMRRSAADCVVDDTAAIRRSRAGEWADAEVVRRLRVSGAVLIGKLAMHELALGQNVPATRSAWDPANGPGGSSAGAGVAVAVGSALAALGTDAGGSVRIPAALQGVVGLKPTTGLVSRRGVAQPSGSLDATGPVTRTVEDAALLLQAIAGGAPGDPTTCGAGVPECRVALASGVDGLRLGIWPGWDAVDDGVHTAVAEAIRALESAGATIMELVPPAGTRAALRRPAGADDLLAALERAPRVGGTILLAETVAALGPWLRESPWAVEPATLRRLAVAAALPAAEVAAARRAREAVRRTLAATFLTARVDALVGPVVAQRAWAPDEMITAGPGAALNRFTMPINLAGLPALAVPCGFVSATEPTGFQIVGRPFADGLVLRIGYAYQQGSAWHERVPA